MSRPCLYHYAAAFSRRYELSQAMALKQLNKTAFEIYSAPAEWGRFAGNADTPVVVTSVPLSPSKTFVHVIATSNTAGFAKKWAAQNYGGDHLGPTLANLQEALWN
jgi:hypothetical protein